MKKILICILTIVLIISALPTVTANATTQEIKSIKVTNVKNNSVKLGKGIKLKLNVKVSASKGISKKVTYRSTNKKVVTVSKKGTITAKKLGNAKIIVRSQVDKSKKIVIKVKVIKKCTANSHNWVEQFKTVHHDEVGHYEEVTTEVYYTMCNVCRKKFYGSDAFSQLVEHQNATEYKEVDEDGDVWTFYACSGSKTGCDYKTETKWVVDTKAYDEKVSNGYKCSKCGKTSKTKR